MKCPKCDGCGRIDNPKYYNNSSIWAWEHNIKPSKPCPNCNGTGFIIGNISDIAERLLQAVNGVTITPKEALRMYEAIMA